MLLTSHFGVNLRAGFRARCGPLSTSTNLKDTLHINIETYKDFFLFYSITYSTVGYPKYQYSSLYLLYITHLRCVALRALLDSILNYV